MKVMSKKDYISSLESRRKYVSYEKDVFVDIDLGVYKDDGYGDI